MTGAFSNRESLDENDFRRGNPRFQDENLAANLAIVQKLGELAKLKGCTPAQLALAWVSSQGNDIVAIPGTTRVKNLEQNVAALALTLSASDLAALDQIGLPDAVHGSRYTKEGMKGINA